MKGVGTSSSPSVSRNAIRECKRGAVMKHNVDPSWAVGEGNAFANCAEGDVVDERGQGGGGVLEEEEAEEEEA